MSIVITGISGFFGSKIKEGLLANNYEINPISYRLSRQDLNLLDIKNCDAGIRNQNSDTIIHCAAVSGNIAYNKKFPKEIYYDNTIMSLNVLKAASENPNVKRIVNIISSCAYGDNEILIEDEFWNKLPNSTILFFGLQKRNIVAYSEAISKTTDKKISCLVFNNLTSSGDSLLEEKTKFGMGIIKRVCDAHRDKLPFIICWGDGSPLRELEIAENASQGIVEVLQTDDTPLIMNVVSTEAQEISIKEYAELVKKLVGYKGDILWDTSKPNGQMRKKLDATLCRRVLQNYKPIITFEEGIKKTIEYYQST